MFLTAIITDFADHGAEAIARLRTEDPATYLRLIGALVPRELILQREEAPVTDYAELSDAEVFELLEARRKGHSSNTP